MKILVLRSRRYFIPYHDKHIHILEANIMIMLGMKEKKCIFYYSLEWSCRM